MAREPRMIELVLRVDPDNTFEPVVDSERTGPTCIEITPVVLLSEDESNRQVTFRVAFEPQNADRRKQPYRENIAPVFPNGWKIGDKWEPTEDI